MVATAEPAQPAQPPLPAVTAPPTPDAPRPGLPRAVQFVLGVLAPAGLLIYNLVQAAPLTIDDSYISFRFARNLARGLGLVYNAGERIEGYTNFLWTVILALGIKLGVDPNTTAKYLGSAAALGTIYVVWRLSERILPFKWAPAIAPWLLASSMTFAGYAVLGLETALFIFLITLGLLLLTIENDTPERFPYSGIVYGLAGLTRPEAPMFLGLAMLLLGKRFLAKQNLTRGALFAGIIGVHLLWRHSYYGAWLPNTFSAKTGNLHDQSIRGLDYVSMWLDKVGAVGWFALLGATTAIARRSRLALTALLTTAAVTAYVISVGGDWMPVFRFMAPLEPFGFLLIDLGVRSVMETRQRSVLAAMTGFALFTGWQRGKVMGEQTDELMKEKRNWDASSTVLANWFKEHNQPGTIAMGDIGYVGWATDYPILDILGLVDPVIAALPGGYTWKQGPRYVDYFFERMPEYFILISKNGDCDHPFHPAIAAIYRDPKHRFKENYQVAHRLNLSSDGFGWCIYQHHPAPAELNKHVVFDFENGIAGWTATGNAFENGPSTMNPPNEQPLQGGEGQFVASSFHPRLGDSATGTLTSPPFVLDRSHLGLLVGGGSRVSTRVELLIDGRPIYNSTGVDSEQLFRVVFDVSQFVGKTAQLRLVDEDTAPWGHILADQVELFDTP